VAALAQTGIVTELTNDKLGGVEVMFGYTYDVGLYFIGKVANGGKVTTPLIEVEAICDLTVDSKNVGCFAGKFIAPKGVG
jgi:hypothetical protein